MPRATLWRDLHRVDVWELLVFPHEVAQFFRGEDFLEIFEERGINGSEGSLAG